MLVRAPNLKAATAYLLQSGAAPITIVSRGDAANIITSMTTSGTIKGRWWLQAQDADRVASAASRLAAESPDVSSPSRR
jgi:hypothetical protein